MEITVIVPTVRGGPQLRRLLDSLDAQTVPHQTIVIENGSLNGSGAKRAGVDLIRLDYNIGFGRAVNLAAERAEGTALVLINDDCVCDASFLEEITRPLAPADGTVMVAGVLRSADLAGRIDTAGMELDATLLPFDYLNGASLEILETGVPAPIGPSAAAAAFDRDAYVEIGGFDEHLFAYWEDVDLVLRLRSAGATCALAPQALGTHEHSATLGSGSQMKNYLMGFGRAYVLRKWGVLGLRRLPQVAVRELVLCAGQALVDHNVAGVLGRIHGFRAAREVERRAYPDEVLAGWSPAGAIKALGNRARRRRQLARARRA
jgi:N-acetylglucosaminyl-diphospho-decaprenol L-rhamnosyltransferase